jgi:aminoglycoside 6'-N-acetyltransferase I
MTMIVRAMQPADHAAWVRMRAALWPEDGDSLPRVEEIATLLREKSAWAFLVVTENGTPAGFAEVALRTCANGCDSQPVPFLEGIWVEPPFRRRGIGKALIRHIEAFLAARGFNEIGSDALIDNTESHAAHGAWGFTEVERVVCFRKTF